MMSSSAIEELASSVEAIRAEEVAYLERLWALPAAEWNGLTATDLFCGAGGSSSGLVAAGYKVVIAANHWQMAIDSHQVNHPTTDHTNADISQVNPAYFPTTDILWASPECTNHSVAKGVKRQRANDEALFELDGTRPLPDEAANRSRATMWDVPRFAEYHKYRAIIIENVVDAYRWVPFPAWLQTMELLGYEHQLVWLNSMHAQGAGIPAPQSRDRMYIVFTRTGERKPDVRKWTSPRAYCIEHGFVHAQQVMKKKEAWGRYKAQYVYRCPKCGTIVEPAWLAAESVLDFSNKGERIADRKTPLSAKTERRGRGGIERYWRPLLMEAAGNTYDSADQKHPQFGQPDAYLRAWPIEEPFRTLHATASKALVVPPLLTDGIHGEGTVRSAADPMNTQTTAQTKGVVFPPLIIPVEGREGKEASPATEPLRTQTTRHQDALIIPFTTNNTAKPATDPLDTVRAGGNHHGLLVPAGGTWRDEATSTDDPMPARTTVETDALLVPYYGSGTPASVKEPHRTLTTTDRYGLLEAGVSIEWDDCFFRMLTPDEIKQGMAFTASYVLLGNKREQVKQAGNAVTPPAARDLGVAVAEALNGVELERVA